MILQNYFCLTALLLLLSCTSGKKEDLPLEKIQVDSAMMAHLIDLGTKTFPLDTEADFSFLQGLQLTKLEDGREYLSFSNNGKRLIYLYDYKTEEIFNKVRLASEGPNNIQFFFNFNYFFHTSDSIFIDTRSKGYYLIDDSARVLNKIGGTGNLLNAAGNKISFDAASRFVNGQIHGAFKATGSSPIEGLANTRATLGFNNKVVVSPIHARQVIHDFDKAMDIRKQQKADGKTTLTMTRQYAKSGDLLFAGTPISDSVRVFLRDSLVEVFYASAQNSVLPDYKEYINLVQIKNVPGEVSRVSELTQPAQYTNTFVDSKGQYLYRVLVTGTKPATHPISGREFPSPIGAVLLVIDLETRKTYQMELPVDEIQITARINQEVFVSDRGIHFKAKGQENEDEVRFRVFGISSEVNEL